jgi:RNA polymerase sigma-70 factor, ECF subfamily
MRNLTAEIQLAKNVPDEDYELVLAAQLEPALFHRIYERWITPVYQYFYHRTSDVQDAEDLTSQLFLAAMQALPRYRHRGHFPAWLFSIARNMVNDYYRKGRREAHLEKAIYHTNTWSQYQLDRVDHKNPERVFSRKDEIQRLVRLVHELPQEEQELIRLRYVADLRFADIAVVINKSEAAVKKALYRLQERLHEVLKEGRLPEEDHE